MPASKGGGAGAKVPYWALSRFYFVYFAALGALLPYWSLFLEDWGFSAEEIGWLLAVMTCTRVVAPNLWGWLADRTQQRLRIIRLGAFLGFLFFLGIFFVGSFLGLAFFIFCYSFFWNAILAQFEVVTLGHLSDKRSTYSQIRLWGSVGFIVAVILIGWVLDFIAIRYLPLIIAIFMLMIWVSTLRVSERPLLLNRTQGEGFLRVLRTPQVLVFLVTAFLLQVAHAPYYVFFSLFLEKEGYSRTLIGQLWALGVIAEVVVFMLMPRIMARFTLRQIMLVSLAFTAVRWLMIAYGVGSISLLLAAQCLHAFSFGTLHAVAIELVHRYFGGGHEGQGQAVYSASSFGLGGAFGAVLSGYIWSGVGPLATFEMSFLVSLIALILSYGWLRTQQFQ